MAYEPCRIHQRVLRSSPFCICYENIPLAAFSVLCGSGYGRVCVGTLVLWRDGDDIAQAFQLITGPLLNGMLGEPDNRIGKALAKGQSPKQIIDEMYLAALCRRPAGGCRPPDRR